MTSARDQRIAPGRLPSTILPGLELGFGLEIGQG